MSLFYVSEDTFSKINSVCHKTSISYTVYKLNDYIKEVAGQKLFQIEQLEESLLYNDYWDTSYTKYENRVGLASRGKFLQDSQDVVLDFPFKDGVLTASMTKEDAENGYDDAFLNEVIEKDEIDRLFDKKVLANVKRFGLQSAEQSRAEQSRAEQSRAEQSRAEQSRAEQSRAEVDNGIVSFDKEKDNLIIKGNNLLALHTISHIFSGQVKLIYIDTPYNTGNDGFTYNDKFNHSSWLTFIKNRLEIAKKFLSDEGIIIVQCDDNEQAYLKVLMDDVFGVQNFQGTIVNIVKTEGRRYGSIAKTHEYALVYSLILNKNRILNYNRLYEIEIR